jgi:hypothetical protein
MKLQLPGLTKGKLMIYALLVACAIVLGLGYAGVIPMDSPVEKAAEEVLETETGIDVKIPPKQAAPAVQKP